LPGLLVNTFWLVLGVAAGTAVIGVSLAWFTAVCEFPGRNFFSWALLLPLAIPAYVIAFVALGLFDYTGPVQTIPMYTCLPATPFSPRGGERSKRRNLLALIAPRDFSNWHCPWRVPGSLGA
jgi:ABC-type Fe3+ transport system permease subunit